MGIPGGLEWASLVPDERVGNATPESIQNELRRRGLWTADDLMARHTEALGPSVTRWGQKSPSKKRTGSWRPYYWRCET